MSDFMTNRTATVTRAVQIEEMWVINPTPNCPGPYVQFGKRFRTKADIVWSYHHFHTGTLGMDGVEP